LGILPVYKDNYDLLGIRFIDASGNSYPVEYSRSDRMSGKWKVSTQDGSQREVWPDAVIQLKNGAYLSLPVNNAGRQGLEYVTAVPIGTADELNQIRGGKDKYPLNWLYIQYADIDLAGYPSWNPIAPEQGRPFEGTYEGQGRFIYNLNITLGSRNSRRGLFGNLGMDGILRNLNVTNGTVSGTSMTGGLAGHSEGTIINSSFFGMVNGGEQTGGIVGVARGNGEISNCMFSGNVIASSKITGGIVGQLEGPSLQNCTNMGTINAQDQAGGLVGLINSSSSRVIRSVNSGPVQGKRGSGGIAGYNSGGTIQNCRNNGEIQGEDGVGGIAGEAGENGTITGCDNRGSIRSPLSAGGIVGSARQTTISASRNIAGINVPRNAGGIAGNTSTGTNIYACYNTGSVSSRGPAGGIVGNNTGTFEVIACYNTAQITGAEYDPGGIVGRSTTDTSKVLACYYYEASSQGIAGIGLPSLNQNAKPFGDTSFPPPDPWPRFNTSTYWGTGDGSEASKWWKSLGAWNNGSNPSFPTLYWE
jgi:hypothetical protein